MDFAEFLYDALQTEFGLVIETDDAEFLRQKLYAIRRERPDPELTKLSFIISPFNHRDLWVVKHGGSSE